MSTPLRFTVVAQCRSSAARLGRIETLHGSFDTPAFIPVGSRGSVRGLSPQQLRSTGTQIVLANAYHLMLRPGAELIARLGGLHRFMAWDGPILTDSGGYQAYSMADINRIDDDGVTFRSIIDGSMVHLGPQRSIEVQNALGADIIMAFDDCRTCVERVGSNRRTGSSSGPQRDDATTSTTGLRDELRVAHHRTVRWLQQCRAAHQRPDEQALFGIVQGGTDLQLRRESVEAVCNVELPGYAIGGVAMGEEPKLIHEVVQFTAPRLPADKPRYVMGVGYECDLVVAVRAGADMFDCVLPTRNGRNANAFTRRGRMHLRNARFREDQRVLEVGCDCVACAQGFSLAYLRHLFLAGEMLGPILLSLHNIRHFQRLMLDIHRAIREDSWSDLLRSWPVLESGAPDEAADGLHDSKDS